MSRTGAADAGHHDVHPCASSVGHIGAFLGDLGSALMGSIQHPDNRSWLTLPNQVFVARVSVPKNQKSLKLQTFDATGQPLASTDVRLAKNGPTVVYAVSYDRNIRAYANAFSWVELINI